MTTKNELERHLAIALNEIGEIKPWFDNDFNEWIYSHDLYPVEYAGETKKQVIQNYPLCLQEFIKHRLNDNLSPEMEKRTIGLAGKVIKSTLRSIKKVKWLGDYLLELIFDNDEVREIEIKEFVKGWGGVFRPFKDISFFKNVKIDKKFGSLVWPNGVDLCPDTLYREGIIVQKNAKPIKKITQENVPELTEIDPLKEIVNPKRVSKAVHECLVNLDESGAYEMIELYFDAVNRLKRREKRWTFGIQTERDKKGNPYYIIHSNEFPGICTDCINLEEGMKEMECLIETALEIEKEKMNKFSSMN